MSEIGPGAADPVGPADPVELLEVATEAAAAAAALVRERRRGAVAVAATKSTPTDVVTEADRASESLIREVVARRRPGDAFHGEEGDDTVGSTGVRWIVDPIDGTVNYLYGIGRYAVSIAAEHDGRVVAGVVVDVDRDVWFTAHRTATMVEARRDGRPLAVRPPVPLDQRLVATGFSYDARIRQLQAAAMVTLLPRVRDLRRMGSAALDICGVAEGTLDAYVEEGVHVWDHAAACLVAEGAGARWEVATGVGGTRFIQVAPGHGYDELWTLVAEAGLLAPDAVAGVAPD
ncbi:MAG: inositol monophosphatase family protein [Nocardioides sp.]|uniref:inositol monophosphatase family protein n=1 Tax=Nocardioides sp. TaxID=35761 RepID=UPI0039E215E5